MFRKKPLEKLQAPDSLDELLVVVRPRAALILATLLIACVIGIVWSVVARIPITVSGYGILLKPRSIKAIQTSGNGVVTDVSVLVGEFVKAGQTIVTVEQPELVRQLEQQSSEYRTLSDFHQKAIHLAEQRRDLELQLIAASLRDNQESTEALTQLRQKMEKHLASQQKQLASVSTLVDQGVTSDSLRLNIQANVNDTEQRVLRMEQELASFLSQQKQLELQRRKAGQDFEVDVHNRRQGLESLAAGLRLTKERLHRQSGVRTRYQGRVLEVAASVGQVISSASRVAILQVEAQEPFYRVELAEEVRQGTYSLVYEGEETREIAFNADAATILKAIEELPRIRSGRETARVEQPMGAYSFDIHFRSLDPKTDRKAVPADPLQIKDARLLAADGSPTFGTVIQLGDLVPPEDLKHLGFLTIGDGKKVAAGMEVRIDPSNIERQRYGSMIGKVSTVSTFPVTSEGLVNLIGNREVVEALLQRGGTILIEADLERSAKPPGVFRWTSKGPDQEITAGTTTTCRVTVEERRPITFALPLLRKWLLGEASASGSAASRSLGH